jgi:penicillin-binding protein 2
VSISFCLLFTAATFRLADLQVNRSAELAAFRDNRLSHIEQKTPRRGRILDASGKILAEDRPTQNVWLIPARRERVNRRLATVSNLPPLSVEQMLLLAASRGDENRFERGLALTALADSNPLVGDLAERLDLDRREVAEKILAAALSGRPQSDDDLTYPRLAIEDVDFALALEIRASLANPYADSLWKAVEMRTGGKRHYPAGAALGHLTGTVGRLSPEEYEELRGGWTTEGIKPGRGNVIKQGRVFFSITGGESSPTDEELILTPREIKRSGKMIRTQGYLANEMVGRGGLEQYYNQTLRGRHRLQSLRLIRDAASGRRRFSPLDRPERAVNGADIRVSLRLEVQRQAQEIMERHLREIAKRPELASSGWIPSGVAIMMDPRNGRIHALVSLPAYDPNTFNRDFPDLSRDPAVPLLDRSMSGIYPPGSVMKPLVGLAALSEEAVLPGQRFHCDRVLMLGGARFTCLGRHGDQDIESALMHSCNIFFYHAGEELGGRRLYEWYVKAGFGRRTGLDLAGEADGILPRRAYTRRGWATGNTYHLAIGQGMAATPMQVAVLYAALANAERNVMRVVRPHLLLAPIDPPKNEMEEELAAEALEMDQPTSETLIDPEALAIVRQGLWEAVQGKPETGESGSGRQAAFPIPGGGFLLEMAGKTGTAEWSEVVDGKVRKQISHVWFAAYAPFDRPEVVTVVMLPEAGGGGGGTCAPIAKDLLRLWFNLPERIEGAVEDREALG